jgi:hypothetical protein
VARVFAQPQRGLDPLDLLGLLDPLDLLAPLDLLDSAGITGVSPTLTADSAIVAMHQPTTSPAVVAAIVAMHRSGARPGPASGFGGWGRVSLNRCPRWT